MKTNKLFPPYTFYPNKIDQLFVWMCDDMGMSEWYDGSDKWDLVLQIYDADCYNSGMVISLDENKRFKKITEETVSKKEFELNKKIKHEEFLDSISID